MRIVRLTTALLALACTLALVEPLAASEIVLYASDAATISGGWRREADATAAEGTRLRHPNAGAAKLGAALASPTHYFEIAFDAEAGVAYRLWMRGRADSNYWGNDSVFVQFSGSVDANGASIHRIGTTSATIVNLEDCGGCGLSGWGWQDNGYGSGVLGTVVRFAASGPQRIRVQTREDGFAVDQIVLSSSRFLSASPGALKSDSTIVPRDGAALVRLVRGPYLQQVTASSAKVVWATREPDASELRYSSSAGSFVVPATTTSFPASTTGLGFDYYQHVAEAVSLQSATTYAYDVFTAGVDATPARTFQLTTAPAPTSTSTVRFVAFGDSGVGSSAQRSLASRIAAETFDLSLHGGDVAYGSADGLGGGTFQTLNDWFFDIYAAWLHRRPMWPSMGNHDSRATNADGRPYRGMFDLPGNERYYSFDWGPAHFVALDTELSFQDATRRQAQLDWLDADLASTDRPWRIAFFHRSPFSAGGGHGSDLAVRQAFAPIFERHGVQLVVSAHEHVYERTTPQRITATGRPVVYVVTGGGGGPLYPAGTGAWTAASASRYHYIRGAISGCTLRLEAVDVNGAVFDATTLDRCVAPAPSPDPDVVIYAADVVASGRVAGNWAPLSDASAAAGTALRNPDRGAAKIRTALSAPADYFEYTFDAEAGKPYRLWMRGRATSNYWGNDSVFVQFDKSVTSSGSATFRIGTTSATEVNLEECGGCGLSGWGWQDNGWGTGVLGPLVYFSTSGPQRVRVQVREDGFIIDQIVFSPARFLTTAPGAKKNDSTILPR